MTKSFNLNLLHWKYFLHPHNHPFYLDDISNKTIPSVLVELYLDPYDPIENLQYHKMNEFIHYIKVDHAQRFYPFKCDACARMQAKSKKSREKSCGLAII
jgi:hypothetical protein